MSEVNEIMKKKNNKSTCAGNTHPKHPVRNFFYVLYSLFNAFCFLTFFYALYAPTLPSRLITMIATGGVCLLALAFGVFRPWLGAKR